MKTMRLLAGTTVALHSAITEAFASESVEDFQNDTMIWIFLGMCALIIVGQLLPALRATAPKGKVTVEQMKEVPAESGIPQGKTEQGPGKGN